jgi:hypothetical protein
VFLTARDKQDGHQAIRNAFPRDAKLATEGTTNVNDRLLVVY